MAKVEKLQVSPEWTVEEREKVATLIQSDISVLEEEEVSWRKTILWEAPCYSENRSKRWVLEQMLYFIQNAPAEFLELNRENFDEYVE